MPYRLVVGSENGLVHRILSVLFAVKELHLFTSVPLGGCFFSSFCCHFLFGYYLFNLIEVAPVMIVECDSTIAMLVYVTTAYTVAVLFTYPANFDIHHD